ncbi:uncharacterized protein LOC113207718 [Frankliniella occidentalis]|uniref:Uncharacterized protein LOC113207718 n=1 Tax=Frankliniella occidentalis TaxID=133901 RepID=A0A9C6XCB0_FRAOC|nr:uncharacterized protein LOC113207718 [Frankliniella occidentalis]
MAAVAAPAQHQPSMPLLLLVEQTVLREIVERRVLLDLAPVKTEDGRVSFLPTLNYTSTVPGQLSMSLQDCECTEPCMVLCRMVAGHYRRTQDQRPDAVEEARVILHSDPKKRYTLKSVVTVRYGASSPFKQVTILLQVYDIVCPRPSTGAGLHLNRARMEGTLCDVKLVVEGVELPAHRNVLALRSPVLSNMLTGDFKEARDGRVELLDFSSGAVAKFLEFLYTDQIGDWANSELELLQLSDKYMVPELRSECALRLWSCDPLRALEVLHAAGLCDIVSGPLRRRLTATVVENHKILADTEQWAVFSATYPVLVDTMLGPGSQPSDAPVSVWSL